MMKKTYRYIIGDGKYPRSMKVYTLEKIYSSQLNKARKTGKTSFDTYVTTNRMDISLQKCSCAVYTTSYETAANKHGNC